MLNVACEFVLSKEEKQEKNKSMAASERGFVGWSILT